MARHISSDDEGFVYRAVVEYEHANSTSDRRFTMTYGPYTNVGTARAQITRETTGRRGQWIKNVEARVQRATIEWEDVK